MKAIGMVTGQSENVPSSSSSSDNAENMNKNNRKKRSNNNANYVESGDCGNLSNNVHASGTSSNSNCPSLNSPSTSDTVPLVSDLCASTSHGSNANNNNNNNNNNDRRSTNNSSSSTNSNTALDNVNNESTTTADDDEDDHDPSTPPKVPCLMEKVLPRELLLRVFSFLDVVSLCRAAQVSKSWNSLALDGSNWQSVDLFSFQTDITPSVIQRLSIYTGGFLHALSLKGCKSLTDEALTQLVKSCPNLTTLDLSDCRDYLTDSTCIAIASYCTNLLYLNLSGLPKLTDVSLEALASSVPLATKLVHLDVSSCSSLTSRGLLSLLAGPSNASIAAANASNGNSSALSQLNNWTNGNLHGSNSSLPSNSSSTNFRPFSSLNFFAAKMDENLINDVSISALARTAGENVKTLLLNGCKNITDNAVSVIAANCPNIRNLGLSLCTNLTDASLQSLAASATSLTTLEVASCSQLTDTGLSALARGCRGLTRLDLEEVVQITDTSVSVLVSHCLRLSTLTLSHCELITDEGIRAISTNSQYLQVLELDNCALLTDTSLDHLYNLKSLRRLEIYDCPNISRFAIRKIQHASPSLLVHAYFADTNPVPDAGDLPGGVAGPAGARRTICRCCVLL